MQDIDTREYYEFMGTMKNHVSNVEKYMGNMDILISEQRKFNSQVQESLAQGNEKFTNIGKEIEATISLAQGIIDKNPITARGALAMFSVLSTISVGIFTILNILLK